MAKMLRHKETGELFIWTGPLSQLSELEPVVDDPVAEVIAEMSAQAKDETQIEATTEVVVEEVMTVPDFVESVVEVSDFVEAPVETPTSVEIPAEPIVVRATTKKRNKAV